MILWLSRAILIVLLHINKIPLYSSAIVGNVQNADTRTATTTTTNAEQYYVFVQWHYSLNGKIKRAQSLHRRRPCAPRKTEKKTSPSLKFFPRDKHQIRTRRWHFASPAPNVLV